MINVTIIYNKQMKMSDLIDSDYRLLLLLNKLNIKLGFGEKSVDAVCKKASFDADCFIFLANFHSGKKYEDIERVFNKLPLDPFLLYLNGSHDYFLKYRLPNIKRKISLIFNEEEYELKELVLNFFDNYMYEVFEHMRYEDEVVFPYIRSLLANKHTESYSINIFEERHNDIEEKVHDLKQILLKYVSGIKDQKLMTNILMELYMCQEELESHTFIEDELVIPRVKQIESTF